MLKFADIRFDKVIFAGSILPRDFDWGLLLARDQISFVRNECGQKDPWPTWAGRLVAHAGTGGSKGFEWFSSSISNEIHEWHGHSDALMRQHIESHWKPFLLRAPSPLVLVHGREIQDGKQFSDILDHTGEVIDAEVYGPLPHYHDVEIPRGLSLTWIRVNPDIYTFLVDRNGGTPAGYINAMPLEDEWYARVRSGELADNEIRAEAIVPWVGSKKTLKVYMMSIATAEKYRRWGDGILQQAYFQLISGLVDKYAFYFNHHGVRVTHMLGVAWTDEGKEICKLFGMNQIGKDKFGDSIFEMRLDPAKSDTRQYQMPVLRKLTKLYRSRSS